MSFIIGNKIDIKGSERSVGDLNFITNRQLKQLEKYEHFEVSAKDGTGVEQLFNKIVASVQARKLSVISSKSSQQHLDHPESAKRRCCF